MNANRAHRIRRIVVWVVVVIVSLPILYVVFEYINTNLLSPTLPPG